MLGPEQERITLARIRGVLFRHLRAGPPTGARQAAALADLAGVADGRVDLLAETTGVALGFHEDQIDAALYQGPRRCASPPAGPTAASPSSGPRPPRSYSRIAAPVKEPRSRDASYLFAPPAQLGWHIHGRVELPNSSTRRLNACLAAGLEYRIPDKVRGRVST